jgi:hypothetical protein
MSTVRVITKKPGMVNPPEVVKITKGLDSMQKLVCPRGEGALIERVPGIPVLDQHGIDLFANEEGRFDRDCKPNILVHNYQTQIVGPIFFIGHDGEGASVGLTDAQVEIVQQFMRTVPQSIF